MALPPSPVDGLMVQRLKGIAIKIQLRASELHTKTGYLIICAVQDRRGQILLYSGRLGAKIDEGAKQNLTTALYDSDGQVQCKVFM